MLRRVTTPLLRGAGRIPRHPPPDVSGRQPSVGAVKGSITCPVCDERLLVHRRFDSVPDHKHIRAHIAAHAAEIEADVVQRSADAARWLPWNPRGGDPAPYFVGGGAERSFLHDYMLRADGGHASYCDDKAQSIASFEMTSLVTQLCRAGGLAGLERAAGAAGASMATMTELLRQLPFVYRGERTDKLPSGLPLVAGRGGPGFGESRKQNRVQRSATTVVINHVNELQLTHGFVAVLRDVLEFCSACPAVGNATVLVLCPREIAQDASTYCSSELVRRGKAQLSRGRDDDDADCEDSGGGGVETLLSNVSSSVTLAFLPAYTNYSLCHVTHELFGGDASAAGGSKGGGAAMWSEAGARECKGADSRFDNDLGLDLDEFGAARGDQVTHADDTLMLLQSSGIDGRGAADAVALRQKGAVVMIAEDPRNTKAIDLLLPPAWTSLRRKSPVLGLLTPQPIVLTATLLDEMQMIQRRLCVTQLRQAFMASVAD